MLSVLVLLLCLRCTLLRPVVVSRGRTPLEPPATQRCVRNSQAGSGQGSMQISWPVSI